MVSGTTGATLRTYPSPEPGASFATGADSGAAYVFDGATGHLRFTFTAAAGGEEFGRFFVAGVGDVDGDAIPDIYVGDYADGTDAGSASVFSGADGTLVHRFVGTPGSGMGPGRAAGDMNDDGQTDLIVGSWTASTAAPGAGQVTVFDGRSGQELLTIASQREDEQLGFDAIGIGDATGDGKIDLLVSAANADRVYLFRGPGVRRTAG